MRENESNAATAEPARLRSDLIRSRQESGGQPVFIFKDPLRERFFRFREHEAFILDQLDGATPTETVRQRFEEKLGGGLSSEGIEKFIARLRSLGLLDDGCAAPASAKQGRVRGNLLYLRFKFFDPDRLLTWLVPRLRFFFTPGFVVLSAVVTIFATGLTVANSAEISRCAHGLFRWQSLLPAYVTMLVIIAFHEFAHGLTCKRFGGKVHEIGFLLLFFQPAFYCNVSDAWMFPEKSRRLWVTFAGAYFEVFLWALATVAWRVTDTSTLINYMALVVMLTSGVKSLFNLNPLIKLDGYYLLSDWLEIPNLRARAFGWLRARLARCFTSARVPETTARERRIHLVYGLLAWTYTTWLLGFVLLAFGRFMVGRFQGWGFVVFVALLVLLFQRPLKNLLRAPLALVRFAPGMNVWVKRAVWLLILAGGGAALFLVHTDLRISGPFTVLPIHNADVRVEVEGIIQEIRHDEGDMVKKGDLIATLADRDFQADLRKITAEVAEKQARLKLLKAGTRAEEIDLAKTVLAKCEERVSYANTHLERDRTLFSEKLLSGKELDETRELVSVRDKEFQEARDKLRVLLAGARQEEIDACDAEINRLQAHQRYINEQLGLLQIRSPIDGVITTHKLKDRVSQAVHKGDLVAKVHAMHTITVEIDVPEKEIADVKLGQKVMLKARAYPRRSFEGTVNAIAPVANGAEDKRSESTIRITTQLNNEELLLKSEMTGHAKIICGKHRLLDLVGRRMVRFIKVEFWSWW